MEVTYRVQEGYRLPNLLLPQEAEVHLGKYAELRRQYIKKHRRCCIQISRPAVSWRHIWRRSRRRRRRW